MNSTIASPLVIGATLRGIDHDVAAEMLAEEYNSRPALTLAEVRATLAFKAALKARHAAQNRHFHACHYNGSDAEVLEAERIRDDASRIYNNAEKALLALFAQAPR